MAECDLWNPPRSNKEVEQLSDLEGVSDGPLRWTVRTVLADRAYWKGRAEAAEAAVASWEWEHSLMVHTHDRDMAFLAARHAALVEVQKVMLKLWRRWFRTPAEESAQVFVELDDTMVRLAALVKGERMVENNNASHSR
ncbi:MAG TPA: hypothetical protein VM537_20045 [Anaerolineae bacterium]|nr:hypothetical protein [Anaerolineae bacterium]